MKLLHMIFEYLHDSEIRSLPQCILCELQKNLMLDKKWQIELLGNFIEKHGKHIMLYDCSPECIKNGLYIAYKEGLVWEIGNYKNGKLDGIIRRWYKNGQLKWLKSRRNGNRTGDDHEWYKNGQKHIWSTTHYVNGLKNGKCQSWHKNGQLKLLHSWKNGKYDGVQKGYASNGQIIKYLIWKDDELIEEKVGMFSPDEIIWKYSEARWQEDMISKNKFKDFWQLQRITS